MENKISLQKNEWLSTRFLATILATVFVNFLTELRVGCPASTYFPHLSHFSFLTSHFIHSYAFNFWGEYLVVVINYLKTNSCEISIGTTHFHEIFLTSIFTWLLGAGYDIRMVQDLSGHQDVKTMLFPGNSGFSSGDGLMYGGNPSIPLAAQLFFLGSLAKGLSSDHNQENGPRPSPNEVCK